MSHRNTAHLDPPHSLEAERAVIGSIIKNNEALDRVVQVLTGPTDFYVPKHQMIYRTSLELSEKSEPRDVSTVAIAMQKKGELEKVGGRLYLVELVEEVASTGNVGSYANLVLEAATRRRIVNIANDATESAYSGRMDAATLLDSLQQQVFDLGRASTDGGFVKLSSCNDEYMDWVEACQKGDTQERMINTGFLDLDDALGGVEKPGLMLFGARTSQGKTQFAMQMAENVAKTGVPVAVLSLETSRLKINSRLHCSLADVNSEHVRRKGMLQESDYNKLVEASYKSKSLPIYIDDSWRVTPMQLQANVRLLNATLKKNGTSLGLVVVDYVQLVETASKKKNSNREQEVAEIGRMLQVVAGEEDVVVLALSQLNDDGAQNNDKPKGRMLRESKALAHAANVILLPYHWSEEGPNGRPISRASVIIDKNKEGGRGGEIFMTFNEGRWGDYHPEEEYMEATI